MSKQTWIELSPTYLSSTNIPLLTDKKRRPIEAVLFVNHCTYNPDVKVPTLRRRVGIQPLEGFSEAEIEDGVIAFATRPNVRLLVNGLESNDFNRLPPEVKRPADDIVNGTAPIYDREFSR